MTRIGYMFWQEEFGDDRRLEHIGLEDFEKTVLLNKSIAFIMQRVSLDQEEINHIKSCSETD